MRCIRNYNLRIPYICKLSEAKILLLTKDCNRPLGSLRLSPDVGDLDLWTFLRLRPLLMRTRLAEKSRYAISSNG